METNKVPILYEPEWSQRLMVIITNEGEILAGITHHWKLIKVTLKCLSKDQLSNYKSVVNISFVRFDGFRSYLRMRRAKIGKLGCL
jgi:hypothetical protein